ncbi:carbon-nitrogen hydrolase family protein [Qaidamihabitans albus]|uniref:carbon-nitrogen hydrolase family protein n=1 Tax=Qaidamihabitans albus TaxID=2795733 RepID=UPI0018F10E54|nr:carbon-nitrogen hydrolase family protein [Qaidamihabitans albus]
MKIAVSGFAASAQWQDNLAVAGDLVGEAEAGGADLLVLPEGVLARFTDDLSRITAAAQPLDGPFVTGLLDHTRGRRVTVVAGVHEAHVADKVFNTLVVARDGELVTVYRKLHLYDAFSTRESEFVTAGDRPPPVFACGGHRVGVMTCYDVRFPEVARLLADQGADVVALPAAWVRGPLKEHHWDTMVTARALENTYYVAASGECGPRNIGGSLVVDPLGVAVARLGERPGTVWADIDPARLRDARAHLPVLANRRFGVDPAARTSTAIDSD